MSIDWVNVAFVVATVALFYWGYWARQKSLRGWVRDLAAAVRGTQTDGRTIVGTREGLKFRIQYATGVNDSPLWHLEFPEVVGPSFAVRVESGGDRRFKRLGFVRETTLQDEALDRRHLIASNDPEGLEPYFHTPEILAALKPIWPENERDESGTIRWIQSGDGLRAVIDVSQVSEATFDERIDELLGRVARFAVAMQRTPAPELKGEKLEPAALDVNRDIFVATLVSAIMLPVLLNGATILHAFTWTADKARGYMLLWGLLAGLALALGRLVLARGKTTFHRRLWQSPAIVMGSVALAWFAQGPINLLREEPPQTQTVKVVGSYPEGAGIFEVWALDFDGVGEVLVPQEIGQEYEKDDVVQVTWTRGYLGHARLLAIEKASSVKTATSPTP